LSGKTVQKLAPTFLTAFTTVMQLYFLQRLAKRSKAFELQACTRADISNRDRLPDMTRIETFWMTCDSTAQLRAEYGPFSLRTEAEAQAQRLGFGFLLRYEHIINDKGDIEDVRCVFIELPERPQQSSKPRLHTRCATCGEMAVHHENWRAEVWADIHEFEHTRHKVRLFELTTRDGLKEIPDWRNQCA
jgi:hypothetical protein